MALVKKNQPKVAPCLLCGEPSPQTICLKCEIRVQGEAIDKKRQIEKKGRTEEGK